VVFGTICCFPFVAVCFLALLFKLKAIGRCTVYACWTACLHGQPTRSTRGLGGSLLVQLCIEGAQLAFTWVSGSVLIHTLTHRRLRSAASMQDQIWTHLLHRGVSILLCIVFVLQPVQGLTTRFEPRMEFYMKINRNMSMCDHLRCVSMSRLQYHSCLAPCLVLCGRGVGGLLLAEQPQLPHCAGHLQVSKAQLM
jgi:hypothetical protein